MTRDAARAQPPDLGEQPLGLARGERGGGLVEDDDPRVGAQRLGDLDQLPLALAEPRHRRARGDVELDRGQQLAGALAHLAAVDERQARRPASGTRR